MRKVKSIYKQVAELQKQLTNAKKMLARINVNSSASWPIRETESKLYNFESQDSKILNYLQTFIIIAF